MFKGDQVSLGRTGANNNDMQVLFKPSFSFLSHSQIFSTQAVCIHDHIFSMPHTSLASKFPVQVAELQAPAIRISTAIGRIQDTFPSDEDAQAQKMFVAVMNAATFSATASVIALEQFLLTSRVAKAR